MWIPFEVRRRTESPAPVRVVPGLVNRTSRRAVPSPRCATSHERVRSVVSERRRSQRGRRDARAPGPPVVAERGVSARLDHQVSSWIRRAIASAARVVVRVRRERTPAGVLVEQRVRAARRTAAALELREGHRDVVEVEAPSRSSSKSIAARAAVEEVVLLVEVAVDEAGGPGRAVSAPVVAHTTSSAAASTAASATGNSSVTSCRHRSASLARRAAPVPAAPGRTRSRPPSPPSSACRPAAW